MILQVRIRGTISAISMLLEHKIYQYYKVVGCMSVCLRGLSPREGLDRFGYFFVSSVLVRGRFLAEIFRIPDQDFPESEKYRFRAIFSIFQYGNISKHHSYTLNNVK